MLSIFKSRKSKLYDEYIKLQQMVIKLNNITPTDDNSKLIKDTQLKILYNNYLQVGRMYSKFTPKLSTDRATLFAMQGSTPRIAIGEPLNVTFSRSIYIHNHYSKFENELKLSLTNYAALRRGIAPALKSMIETSIHKKLLTLTKEFSNIIEPIIVYDYINIGDTITEKHHRYCILRSIIDSLPKPGLTITPKTPR